MLAAQERILGYVRLVLSRVENVLIAGTLDGAIMITGRPLLSQYAILPLLMSYLQVEFILGVLLLILIKLG